MRRHGHSPWSYRTPILVMVPTPFSSMYCRYLGAGLVAGLRPGPGSVARASDAGLSFSNAAKTGWQTLTGACSGWQVIAWAFGQAAPFNHSGIPASSDTRIFK